MARLKCNGGEVFHRNFMGAVAQLDADTVDNMHAAALLPSDSRLKSNITQGFPKTPVEDILEMIVRYRYNESPDVEHYGVIAQKLQHDAGRLGPTVHVGEDGYLSINPIDVLFYMVSSLALEVTALKDQTRQLIEAVNTLASQKGNQ